MVNLATTGLRKSSLALSGALADLETSRSGLESDADPIWLGTDRQDRESHPARVRLRPLTSRGLSSFLSSSAGERLLESGTVPVVFTVLLICVHQAGEQVAGPQVALYFPLSGLYSVSCPSLFPYLKTVQLTAALARSPRCICCCCRADLFAEC